MDFTATEVDQTITGLRMNKSLYSLSYTCVTAGTAGLFFTGIYLLVCNYKQKEFKYLIFNLIIKIYY